MVRGAHDSSGAPGKTPRGASIIGFPYGAQVYGLSRATRKLPIAREAVKSPTRARVQHSRGCRAARCLDLYCSAHRQIPDLWLAHAGFTNPVAVQLAGGLGERGGMKSEMGRRGGVCVQRPEMMIRHVLRRRALLDPFLIKSKKKQKATNRPVRGSLTLGRKIGPRRGSLMPMGGGSPTVVLSYTIIVRCLPSSGGQGRQAKIWGLRACIVRPAWACIAG